MTDDPSAAACEMSVKPAAPMPVQVESGVEIAVCEWMLIANPPGYIGPESQTATILEILDAWGASAFLDANGYVLILPKDGVLGEITLAFIQRDALGDLSTQRATIQISQFVEYAANSPPITFDEITSAFSHLNAINAAGTWLPSDLLGASVSPVTSSVAECEPMAQRPMPSLWLEEFSRAFGLDDGAVSEDLTTASPNWTVSLWHPAVVISASNTAADIC